MDFLEKVTQPGKDQSAMIRAVLKTYLPAGVILLIVIIGLWGSFYTVATDSQGVIRRFGRYARTTDPGLHGKLPFGIERVSIVPVKKIQKEEFGFRTMKAGIKSEYVGSENISRYSRRSLGGLLKEKPRGYSDTRRALADELQSEYLMLTGDLNVADVEWVVQYRIKDPAAYLFNIRDQRKTLRDLSQVAMRRVVGDASVDEVITVGRREIETEVARMLQGILDGYDTGIKVVTVKLQSVNPPRRVRPAFNQVNEAKQDRERLINEAWSAYNESIPEARGEAKKIKLEADAYAVERVNHAQGDASKFTSIYRQYKLAQDVTRRRLYLEAAKKMLANLKQIWVIEQKGAEGGVLQQLQLGGEK